jgi:hypothetical protein
MSYSGKGLEQSAGGSNWNCACVIVARGFSSLQGQATGIVHVLYWQGA